MRSRVVATCLLLTAALAIAIPLAPSARSKASDLVAARNHFFGKANVDQRTGRVRPDVVLMSWFGVANYVASFNGHVVLLDAWVARGSHSGYVPTSPAELISLRPEFIFIGHGDFDHAADAAEVAAGSGAVVVGTEEHCTSIRSQQPDANIECVELFPAGAPAGAIAAFRSLPGVGVTAITHIHSSVERPEYQDGGRLPCIPIWNARDSVDHPPTADDVEHLLRHLPDARGGNVLYQFRVGRLAIAWHDTTGKIEEDAPQVIDALRSLPPTDVHFGAVLAFGQVTNCFRSLGAYIEALSPKIYAATHHDNFTYLIGANAADLEPFVRDEIDRTPEPDRPELLYSYDPQDYLDASLYTFDPRAKSFR